MKALIIMVSLLFAVYVPTGNAECTCRAKNVIATEGQIVCLWTPNGGRLARCEKVLNNTSWTFLPGECSDQTT